MPTRRANSQRTMPVTGYFEPLLVDIVDRFCTKMNEGRSSYVYRLVVKDLIDQGMLTHDMATNIRLGEPVA